MGKLSYKVESELELKNSLYIAQINTENFNFDQIRDFDYKPLSAYPFIKFDLSFSVPINFQASDLTNYIESIISENENNISIFDNFTNEKTRNLGIRIITRSYEKTYTETESTEILEMIVKEVESKFKLKLNKRDENAI
jgi:phenylalanyl-tRNA synthetase beta subunit